MRRSEHEKTKIFEKSWNLPVAPSLIASFQSTMPGGVGVDEGSDEFGWVVAKDKPKYDEIFNTLEQDKGKVTGDK